MTTLENLDPTTELTIEVIKKRAVKGIVALTGRTLFLQAINFLAFIFFSLFLKAEEYGTFIVVSAAINFLAYFSDIGLAAALIQKKESPERRDLTTTFTIQQILVLSLLALLYFLTPFLKDRFELSSQGVILLYALGISFLLSSLKTIPSILLERQIEFRKLIIPQIGEALVFNIVAVFLAWRGFGIEAFTYAVLARGVVGLVLMYALMPWMPGISLSLASLKKFINFGVPYQLNTVLAVIKDDGITLFLGGAIGTSGVGLVGWAKKWADAPLRFFMDAVIKVTFPAYSRLQGNKVELGSAVSRSLFFISFLVFPTLVGIVFLSPLIVAIIPKYERWQPALLALSFFGVNTMFAAITTPLTNLFNSIGKITVTFKLMIMWTVATWVLVPFMAINYGVTGVGGAAAIIGTTSIVAIWVATKYIKIDFTTSVFKPGLGALAMTAVLFLGQNILPQHFFSVAGLSFLGILTYLIIVRLLVGEQLVSDVKKFIRAVKEK